MPKKQKSGLYRAKVKVGTDQTGKPIVKWVSGKTQKELEDESAKSLPIMSKVTCIPRSSRALRRFRPAVKLRILVIRRHYTSPTSISFASSFLTASDFML